MKLLSNQPLILYCFYILQFGLNSINYAVKEIGMLSKFICIKYYIWLWQL